MNNKTKKIHTAYFRETRTCYTVEDFNNKLGLNSLEKAKLVIASLKRIGIAKVVKKTDFNLNNISEKDTEYLITDEIPENSKIGYIINYVGLIYTNNCLLKCYPKYIDKNFENELEAKDKIDKHLKKILKVISRINAKEELVHLFNGEDEIQEFNSLAIELYILEDYYNNGTYSNFQTTYETNGEGEVEWEKSINETYAIIKNKKPYYFDLQTINTQYDELDFFKQLHETIITHCSQELEETGILELYDMSPVELTKAKIEDFGDIEYIKYRLEKELQLQNISKKKNILKALYTFITENKSLELENTIGLLGTNAFNMVWEKTCSNIFNNIKDKPLENLKEQIGEIKTKDCDKKTLKDFIEKAKWWFNEKAIFAAKTLEPDILLITNNSQRNFYILDAKYYYLEIKENSIYHQPGIEDVVKQFAYHKAFFDFLKDYSFSKVANAFLMPKESSSELKENFINIGKVTLDLMQDYAMQKITYIQVIKIDPDFVFDTYLENKTITNQIDCIKLENINE